MLDSDRHALTQAVLGVIRDGCLPDDAFDRLAMELYEFQSRTNSLYRDYCRVRGFGVPSRWIEIPALPASAFKRTAVTCFPSDEAVTYFQTSGTTEGESGRHYFATLDLYEAALVPPFGRYVMAGGERMPMFMLTPPPEEAPHSSLVHMMAVVLREFGRGGAGGYFVRGTDVQFGEFFAALEEVDEPVCILGTAFAFAFVLDALRSQGRGMALAPGSRIMETGGFKGRTRAIEREQFYHALADAFGIPVHCIVNEYGMTELSSQFYDVSLVEKASSSWKVGPPWARVRAIDPLTGKPVPDGERGLLRIYDLANVGSCMCLQTEDVGIMQGERFQVLGRVAQAEPRGCSLMMEPSPESGR